MIKWYRLKFTVLIIFSSQIVFLAAVCLAELPSRYGAPAQQPPSSYYPPPQPQPSYGPPSHSNFDSPQSTRVEITKDVYVHVPPPDAPEEFEGGLGKPVVNRKHYKIIFIKAPSVNIDQMTRFQQQGQQEEKTIVYVLVKKPELNTDLETQKDNSVKSHKPEVYFIKYKTQKEKPHANVDIDAPYH